MTLFGAQQRQVLLYVAALLFVLGYISHSFSSSSSPLSPPPPLVAPPSTTTDTSSTDTFPNLAACPTPPFRFRAPSARNRIVQLASYPGSGNTWVRHLIQRGSGIYTGSAYNDQSLKLVFPGEKVQDGSVICVKTHFPCAGCWYRTGKSKQDRTLIERARSGRVPNHAATVQVLRNPFEAMMSDFNHKQSGANHTGLASEEAVHSQQFVDFVLLKMHTWVDHARHHLKRPANSNTNTNTNNNNNNQLWLDTENKPVLLVYYDDLQANTRRELERMFAFLGEYSADNSKSKARLAARCATQLDVQGGFRRVKPKSEQQDPYDRVVEGESGRTLREVACSFFQQDNAFWRDAWCG